MGDDYELCIRLYYLFAGEDEAEKNSIYNTIEKIGQVCNFEEQKPFQITTLEKDKTSEKTKFATIGTGKKIIVLADYTDNHYVIELDDVVIGAVDSLDPQLKKDYRIEINSIENEALVIAIAIMIDAYSKEHHIGV